MCDKGIIQGAEVYPVDSKAIGAVFTFEKAKKKAISLFIASCLQRTYGAVEAWCKNIFSLFESTVILRSL